MLNLSHCDIPHRYCVTICSNMTRDMFVFTLYVWKYRTTRFLSYYFSGMFMKALVFPSFQGICCQRVNCVDCWSWTSTISVACSMILLSSLWLFVMLSFALRVCSLIRRQVGHTAYALVISSPSTGKQCFHPCLVANVVVFTPNLHKQVFMLCISS